ncbi:hypothetical protein [Psychromonas ossibalaenae]|uniref:hypothetical protein n=1 Tax=Psychromonas ossibalaenae TaxID=444922 RepID=UPI00037AEF3E|nr:hypothetical protein [Psychromonas ossibalaenae]
MRFNNVAPPEVASQHLTQIHAMMSTHSTINYGENMWNSLTPKERVMFCKEAGFQSQLADKPLSEMRPDTRKAIFNTIKRIQRAASLFSKLSFSDFG